MKERIEKLCKTAFQVDYRVRAYSDGKIRSLTEYFIYKEIMKEAVFLTFYENVSRRKRESFCFFDFCFYILKQLYILYQFYYTFKEYFSLKSGLPQLSEEEKKSDEKKTQYYIFVV